MTALRNVGFGKTERQVWAHSGRGYHDGNRPTADILMSKSLRFGITVCIASAFVAGGIWLAREKSIDRCLDRGGAWDYNQTRCDMATKSRPAEYGQKQSFGTSMSNLSPEGPVSPLESFYGDFDWYVGHARSLAMSPEDCCLDQGSYLVSGELFYFLLEPTQLIDDPLGQVAAEQKLAVERLRDSVRSLPPEARSGGPTAAASLADMRHPSWELPRRLACELLAVLAPLATARDAFYEKSSLHQSV